MTNYLKMPKKSHVLALLELGWSYRRIERETGVRRETVSGYDVDFFRGAPTWDATTGQWKRPWVFRLTLLVFATR